MTPLTPVRSRAQTTPRAYAVGRRSLLGAGAGLAGLAASTTLTAVPAAASGYIPAVSSWAPLPTPRELHALRRWTYGYTPEELSRLRAAGGPEQWFEAQLDPASVVESPAADVESWWTSMTATPAQIIAADKARTVRAWEAMDHSASYALIKRATSRRSVLELVTEFWEDHFYIPRQDDGVYPFRIDFGRQIKSLALTSFEQLLQMATLHPAMSVSLDNAISRKSAVNENLGRELLELHTVGVGNYGEDDVKASARLLTGYRVDTWSTWKVWDYCPEWHWVGPVQVMGFSHANASPDGRAAVAEYLRYLAHHPATARRVCRKLAQRFVSDDPDDALVTHLADVYTANDTHVVPVLRALFASQQFWASAGAKVKTPSDEASSLLRAAGAQVSAPTAEDSAANAILWVSSDLGASPWSHPRPDGPPRTNAAWVNPSRFLASWGAHWSAGGGWWPTKDIAWVPPIDRLPAPAVRLDLLVDHLSRTILGEASTPELLEACCTAVGYGPATTVTAAHAIVRWMMVHLVAMILNQPGFYLR